MIIKKIHVTIENNVTFKVDNNYIHGLNKLITLKNIYIARN